MRTVGSGDFLLTLVGALVLYLAFAVFGVTALIDVWVKAPGSTPHSKQNVGLALMAVETVALLLPIWLFLIHRRIILWRDLKLVPCDVQWRRRAMVLGVAVLFLGAFLVGLVRQILGHQSDQMIQSIIAPAGYNRLAAITTILWVGLIIPAVEEIFFRGFLFGWLRARLSFGLAAALSAAAFGLIHGRPEAIVIAFLVGLLQAGLVERSGSLVPAIILHQVYNTLALLLAFVGQAARG